MTKKPPQESSEKTLNLDKLTPPKREVRTSLGTLYARPATALEEAELICDRGDDEVGQFLLRTLIGRNANKEDRDGLVEHDLRSLDDNDIAVLANGIAAANNWPSPADPSFVGLGALAKAEAKRHGEEFRRQMSALNHKLKIDYAFLTRPSFDKLQEQLDRVAGFSNGFSSKAIDELLAGKSFSSKAVDDFLRAEPKRDFISPRSVELEAIRPRRYEETAAGRTQQEVARSTREAAERLKGMADAIGELSTRQSNS